MRSLAISLFVIFVSAAPELVPFALDSHDEQVDSSELLTSQTALEVVPQRRIFGWINDNIVKPVFKPVVDVTVDVVKTAVNGVVDVGSNIVKFTLDLIGPNGFSEKLANEWLNIRIGGNTRVRDVLKSGHSVMKRYKHASCSAMKGAVLPMLRAKIKGQSDGVLYAGHNVGGGVGYGESKSEGVFVDHNGFEGCYTTTCKYFGFHAGGGIGIEAGFLHGEGTNDMPGDATGGQVSFDLGPGLDVVGGFTSGGKGFVEIGTGKGVGANLGSYVKCNTRTYSTNSHTCTVTLYQHDHFRGSRKDYGTGSVPIVWRNDDVSSIKVHGHGCRATVWQHSDYRGWRVSLNRGSYTLSQLKRKGFRNDDMSSLKVQKTRRRSEELMESRLTGFNEVGDQSDREKESSAI